MQNDGRNTPISDDEEARYAMVPDDFPRPDHMGAVAGFQPKLLLTRYKDKFYSPGCTPPEIYARWVKCKSIAEQLEVKSRESKAGKRAHMTESAILEQYFERLLKTGWVSEEEAVWTIRKTGELLDWPLPESIDGRRS